MEAWKLRGHAYFHMDSYFDCEESYIRAIRISGSEVDPELEERLGLIYIKRKSWKDAKVVFLKRVGEGISASSWKNLGLALLKLNELSQAEEALTQANILDNLNAEVWGLLTIMCLQSGEKRIIQARQAMVEAMKLGLENPELLGEIGELFGLTSEKDNLGVECLHKAIECKSDFKQLMYVIPEFEVVTIDGFCVSRHFMRAYHMHLLTSRRVDARICVMMLL